MKRYLIYGAGAMGTVLGAFMSRAGIKVQLVSRNKEHVSALKAHGAKIIGKEEFVQKVEALIPEEMSGTYDVIFLMTKQRNNKEIVSFLKNYLSVDGVICTLQNGLPEFSVSEIIGEDKTYGCAVAWGATFVSSGVSELTSCERSFALGGLNPDKEKLKEIASLLGCMGEVKIEENLIGARFAKLTVNAAFSGISAMTGKTFGFVSSDSHANKYALRIINECFETAKAADIKIEPIQGHDIQQVLTLGGGIKNFIASIALKIAMKKHKDLVSGMLKDIEKGRKCDIDYINGSVCVLASKYGVPTPFNDAVVKTVHEIEAGKRVLSVENIKVFEEI